MNIPLGDFDAGQIVRHKFNTRVGDTLTTLAGSPVIVVYKDDSTTEITAGVTLTIDFDAKTGLHHLAIDTSADAAYTNGSDFQAVLSAGTVGGASVVGELVCSFSLRHRGAQRALSFETQAKADTRAEAAAALATHTVPTLAQLNARTLLAAEYAVASEVTAIQQNTRVVRVVPASIERPASGTTTAQIWLLAYDTAGHMASLDSPPTLLLVNQNGVDRSARLNSALMTEVGAGWYQALYTNTAGDPLEQLLWGFTVIKGGQVRIYGNTSQVVDTTAALADTAAALAAVVADTSALRKRETRRTRVNLTTSKEELYDEAGTSVETSWTLKDKDGADISETSGIFERIPDV